MDMCHLRTLSLFAIAAQSAAFAQCTLEWLPGSGAPVMNGTVRAATLYDPDGPGPAASSLVVAGSFSNSSSAIRDIASWTGVRWEEVALNAFNGNTLRALALFDLDGTGPNPPRLIVGGRFSVGAGFNRADNIASTDGGYPQRMADGLDREVYALHVFDPDGDGPLPGELFAGGMFGYSGQVSMQGVARWNGTQWEAVGGNVLSGRVNAFATVDIDGAGPLPPYLAVGGLFSATGQISNIAFFNGTTWVRLGSLDDEVHSLAAFDFDGPGPDPARIVAGGRFRNSGTGLQLNGQAYYNGTSWQPVISLPQSPMTRVTSVGVHDPDGPGGESGRLFLGGELAGPNGMRNRMVEVVAGQQVVIAGSGYSGDIVAMAQLTPPGENSPAFLTLGSLVAVQPSTPLQLAAIRGSTLAPLLDGFNNEITAMTTSSVT